MKYQALYNVVMDKGEVIFRVKDYPALIAIPMWGWAVERWEGAAFAALADTEAFDIGIERMLRSDCEYIQVKRFNDEWLLIISTDVFKSKEFAMGVAYGREIDGVLDLFKRKTIKIRKGKK
jgi:hypothetical protein